MNVVIHFNVAVVVFVESERRSKSELRIEEVSRGLCRTYIEIIFSISAMSSGSLQALVMLTMVFCGK